jgi:SAM-dependent methyltransferase
MRGYDWPASLESERCFWLRSKDRICSAAWRDHMEQRTVWAVKWWCEHIPFGPDASVLHVGPGADGEINFIHAGTRYAVDPLADFYREHFSAIMDPAVQFIGTKAEAIPLPDSHVDVAMSYNSLDHMEDPSKVMDELHRVLKATGLLYIGVHVRSPLGQCRFRRRLRRQGATDHFFSFTKRSLETALTDHGFSILARRGQTCHESGALSRPDREKPELLKLTKYYLTTAFRTYHVLARRERS